MTALFLGLLASVALATSAQAASLKWSDPIALRDHRYTYITDAAYDGRRVAVVWEESRPRAIAVRTSNDGGRTFAPMWRRSNASEGRVALCGAHVYVVYTRQLASDNLVVQMAKSTSGSGRYDVMTIAGGPGMHLGPDVACNARRVFVSWYETDGAAYKLNVASALAADLDFGTPRSIARDSGEWRSGFRIAATDDSLYAVYGLEATGNVFLKRWSIGPGPSFALSGHPTRVVATGTRFKLSHSPVIGVDGSVVAIAYGKCSGVKIRVSHDRGKTWSAGQAVLHTACGWEVDGGSAPGAVEVAGDTVALTWSAGFIDFTSYLSLSDDDFHSFTRSTLGDNRDDHVGFLHAASGTKLADAFSRATSVKFRREL